MLLYILSKNKLTETFFVHEHFRIRRLFQFISFYSVFNLRRQTSVCHERRLTTAYTSYHIALSLVKHFFNIFQCFLKFFDRPNSVVFCKPSPEWLAYLTTLHLCLSTVFHEFFEKKFKIFFHRFSRIFRRFWLSTKCSERTFFRHYILCFANVLRDVALKSPSPTVSLKTCRKANIKSQNKRRGETFAFPLASIFSFSFLITYYI